LSVLGVASLGLISVTDRFLFNLLSGIESPLAILADLRIPSLILISTIYFLIRKVGIVDCTSEKVLTPKVFMTPMIWLVMTAYFVLVKEVWVPSLKDWIDWIAFMITGLIAEEMLFRGILFDLSSRVFGSQKLLNLSLPVLISSLLFGLQHLSYHGFRFNSASLTQVIYTIVMGIVFANLRESTGRLWLAVLLHMMTNSFTLVRNLS
jgi:membrane protease YdiL (CAAX protease family)